MGHTYTKKVVVYLKFKFNWCLIFSFAVWQPSEGKNPQPVELLWSQIWALYRLCSELNC